MQLEILGYKYTPPEDYTVDSVEVQGAYLVVKMFREVNFGEVLQHKITQQRTHYVNENGTVVIKAYTKDI